MNRANSGRGGLPVPPSLPAGPALLSGGEAGARLYALAAEEETAEGLHLKNADLCGEELARLSFSRCILEGCRFQNADLTRVSFTDCLLKSCDFSGAKLWEGYFSRCRLQSCRALGANFAESRLFNVMFSGCQLRYACFERTRWDRVQAEDTCLVECMVTQAALKQLSFAGADLSGACFSGTPLKGLDLRGCTVTNLSCSEDNRELRGAVVDLLQAAELARLLGVVIRE